MRGGTLDAENVRRWVDFCVGLVRLVEFHHKNPDEFPAKSWEVYHAPDGTVEKSRVDVWDLFEAMGEVGGELGRRCWEEMIERYAENGHDLEVPPEGEEGEQGVDDHEDEAGDEGKEHDSGGFGFKDNVDIRGGARDADIVEE